MIFNQQDIDAIARAAHGINVAYSAHFGDKPIMWDDTTEQHKQSLRAGVKYVLDNPDSTSADQHQLWLDTKIAEGWVYGKVKDVEKKQHPCLVPYTELPDAQQVKDTLFRNIVRHTAAIIRAYKATN